MKQVVITRIKSDANETTGILTVGNEFTCDTLERAWADNQRGISCIPEGTYQVKWGHMITANKDHYEVQNVHNRSAIFIHGGITFLDSHGCIILGNLGNDFNKDGVDDVANSQKTIAAFEAIMNKEDFELTITNGYA